MHHNSQNLFSAYQQLGSVSVRLRIVSGPATVARKYSRLTGTTLEQGWTTL